MNMCNITFVSKLSNATPSFIFCKRRPTQETACFIFASFIFPCNLNYDFVLHSQLLYNVWGNNHFRHMIRSISDLLSTGNVKFLLGLVQSYWQVNSSTKHYSLVKYPYVQVWQPHKLSSNFSNAEFQKHLFFQLDFLLWIQLVSVSQVESVSRKDVSCQ